jgi:hypothetical protein
MVIHNQKPPPGEKKKGACEKTEKKENKKLLVLKTQPTLIFSDASFGSVINFSAIRL